MDERRGLGVDGKPRFANIKYEFLRLALSFKKCVEN